MSARIVLSGARAGQLYVESDRQFLRRDRSVGVLAMHGRVVLPDLGAERADGQLQWRLLLRRGLVNADAVRLFNRHVLPDGQRQCNHVRARIILPVGLVADSLPGRHLVQCNGAH